VFITTDYEYTQSLQLSKQMIMNILGN